jgi:hypothetical protein
MPFTVWSTGQTVTAALFNSEIAEQCLTTWATEAARNSGIASPVEGMFAYTKDSDKLWFYDGSTWIETSLTADITSVTAGAGLSGGGVSGAVSLAVDSGANVTTVTAGSGIVGSSTVGAITVGVDVDAKGDLLVGTAADTVTKLAVGATDGHALVVDSSEAAGVKWAAVESDPIPLIMALS